MTLFDNGRNFFYLTLNFLSSRFERERERGRINDWRVHEIIRTLTIRVHSNNLNQCLCELYEIVPIEVGWNLRKCVDQTENQYEHVFSCTFAFSTQIGRLTASTKFVYRILVLTTHAAGDNTQETLNIFMWTNLRRQKLKRHEKRSKEIRFSTTKIRNERQRRKNIIE